MKKLLIAAFTIAGLSYPAQAQLVKAVQTAKISTPTVGCDECKKRIETYLKRYDGVVSINVNWRRKENTVK